jgi:transposase InsO family protein
MIRRGNCWDNAVAESYFASLKKERLRKRIYATLALAIDDVRDDVEAFYNPVSVTAISAASVLMYLKQVRSAPNLVPRNHWALQSIRSLRYPHPARTFRHARPSFVEKTGTGSSVTSFGR